MRYDEEGQIGLKELHESRGTDIPGLLQSRDARSVERGDHCESAREVGEVQQAVLKTEDRERES